MRNVDKRSEGYKTRAQLKKEKKELKRLIQMEKRFLVGIYDSYRQEGRLHNTLKGITSILIGKYSTEPEYTMYDLGAEGCVIKENGDTSVKIEVWEVNKTILDRLEIQYNYYPSLEGYRQEYSKKTVNSPFGEIILYVYKDECEENQKVLDGDWIEHLNYKKIFKGSEIEVNNITPINK